MGGSNRVEKLENQVRELEATVTGLTDELLECKERLAQLEAATESDAEPTTTTDGDSGADSISSLLDEVDSYSSDDDESTAETETDSDEIIVA